MGIDDVRADSYGDRWADVYDEVHGYLDVPTEQLDLLASLAGGGRALELGIGTGRVALPLAARGVQVEGVDASPAMVERLRAKPGGDDIAVTLGDMADVPAEGPFALVFVVFNTFFNLLDQVTQVRCFRRVAEVLEPGGAFVLECFAPDTGLFDRGQYLRTRDMTADRLRLEAGMHDPVAQTVRSQQVTIADGRVEIRPIALRYAWPSELDLMAHIAGLRLRSRSGSWAGAPFTPATQTHVTIYDRPADPAPDR